MSSTDTQKSRRQQRPGICPGLGVKQVSKALVNHTNLIGTESIKRKAALTLEEVQIKKKFNKTMQSKYQGEAQILEAQQTPVLQLQKENIKTEQLKKSKIETNHLEPTEETSMFTFGPDGAVNISHTGKASFVYCPHILIDIGALVPLGIAISDDFFCNHLWGGGELSRLSPSCLKSAKGRLTTRR